MIKKIKRFQMILKELGIQMLRQNPNWIKRSITTFIIYIMSISLTVILTFPDPYVSVWNFLTICIVVLFLVYLVLLLTLIDQTKFVKTWK